MKDAPPLRWYVVKVRRAVQAVQQQSLIVAAADPSAAIKRVSQYVTVYEPFMPVEASLTKNKPSKWEVCYAFGYKRCIGQVIEGLDRDTCEAVITQRKRKGISPIEVRLIQQQPKSYEDAIWELTPPAQDIQDAFQIAAPYTNAEELRTPTLDTDRYFSVDVQRKIYAWQIAEAYAKAIQVNNIKPRTQVIKKDDVDAEMLLYRSSKAKWKPVHPRASVSVTEVHDWREREEKRAELKRKIEQRRGLRV